MLAELWRITSFRLTVLYGALFTLAVVGLLVLFYAETARYQNRQVDAILYGQSRVFASASRDQLKSDIAYEIKRDIRRINFFGLYESNGTPVAGNLPHPPVGLPIDNKPHALDASLNVDLFPTVQEVRALGFTLPDGHVLVVARDVALLEQIRESLLRGCFAIGFVILALGVIGGVFYSLPAVRHIRAVDETVRRIGAGDYTQRLPTSGRNQELDALARIVNTMLDDTERLMGEVKSCSDNIAHDLRTPLNRLRASIYRGQQSIEPGSPLYGTIDHALIQVDLLLARFRAISRISEIEGKRRHAGFSRAGLAPILRKISDLYEPLAQQSGIRFTLDAATDVAVTCDPELLFEAIGNVVDNAIKFTPPDGRVSVVLGGSEQQPEIAICDTGPGIAESERKLVLQRFYRTEETRAVSGSGLGLSLVDAIVRLHDFKLTIDGNAGEGTCVRVQCWQQTTLLGRA